MVPAPPPPKPPMRIQGRYKSKTEGGTRGGIPKVTVQLSSKGVAVPALRNRAFSASLGTLRESIPVRVTFSAVTFVSSAIGKPVIARDPPRSGIPVLGVGGVHRRPEFRRGVRPRCHSFDALTPCEHLVDGGTGRDAEVAGPGHERTGLIAIDRGEIVFHHDLDELGHANFRGPSQDSLRLARVATQRMDFRGPEVLRVGPDELQWIPLQARLLHRQLQELTDGPRLPGCDHVVVGLFLLEYPPHRLDVLGRVPPVPLRVEIAKLDELRFPGDDLGEAVRDLAGDELEASPRALVIEENPIRRMHAVRLAVVDARPVREDFRHAVRAAGMERR